MSKENTEEIKKLLEKFDAEIVEAKFPRPVDYDSLNEIFGFELEEPAPTHVRHLAIRFNNLRKLQEALEINGPQISEALQKGNMEKLKTALEIVLKELENENEIRRKTESSID